MDEFNNYENSYNTQTIISQGTNVNNSLRSVSELPPLYQPIFSEFQYFNSIQSHLMDDLLLDDSSIVISAPTGSGKTVLFELAIVRLLNACQLDEETLLNHKIVYMAPVKALCTERYNDWERKLLPLGLKAIEVTGDSDEGNLLAIQHFNLVLTTPEKWDSLTRKWRDHSSLISVIKLFLIDEVHLLNEDKRGSTLEAVVSRMKTVQESDPCSSYIRFIAVSATIPNIEDVATWLGKKPRPAKYFKFGEEARPVKLRKIVKSFPFGQAMSYFKFDLNLSYKLRQIILDYSEGKPTLIFCATRKSVVQTSTILLQNITFHFTPAQKMTLEEARNGLQDSKLRDTLRHGVGFHHAGLVGSDRHIVEELFRSGFLPVLICTSTLAMGVNLPAHLVVIKSTTHYTNNAWEEYSEGQILQMMGRAGRPQFDSHATAVILTKSTLKDKYEKLILGNQMVESNLHKNLPEHLNSEIVLGTITDIVVALHWLRSTFFYVRALKNPRHYGIPPGLSLPEQEARLQAFCMRELNGLEKYELVKKTDFAYNVEPTENGKLMARLYIAFETMKIFMKIKGTENLPELLEILCSCHEFVDIKLRVNEKATLNLLNSQKHKETIRFPLQGRIKSREMKINCLLQAVLGCLPLNDHSLIQEGNRILRLAERVTKAVSLYLWQKNYYQALASALTLAKCLSVKMWENSIYLSRHLPGIGPALASLLAAAKKVTFDAIINSNPRDLERILNKHPPIGNNLQEAAKSIPKYSLTVNYSAYMKKVHVTVMLLNAEYVHDTSRTSNLLIADSGNVLLRKEKIRDGTLIECTKGYTASVYIPEQVNCIIVHLISDSLVGVDIKKKIGLSSKECFELYSSSSTSSVFPDECADQNSPSSEVVGNTKKQPGPVSRQKERITTPNNPLPKKNNKIQPGKSQTNLHQYAFKPSKKLSHTQDVTPDCSEVEVSSTQDSFPENNASIRIQNSNAATETQAKSNAFQSLINHHQSGGSNNFNDPARKESFCPKIVSNTKQWNFVDYQVSDRNSNTSKQSDIPNERKPLVQTNLNNFRKKDFSSEGITSSKSYIESITQNYKVSSTKLVNSNLDSCRDKSNDTLRFTENSLVHSNKGKANCESREPLVVSPIKIISKNMKSEIYSSSTMKFPLFLPLSLLGESANKETPDIKVTKNPKSVEKNNQALLDKELQKKMEPKEEPSKDEMYFGDSSDNSLEKVSDINEADEEHRNLLGDNKKVTFNNHVSVVKPAEAKSYKICNNVTTNNMDPENKSETVMKEERTQDSISKSENDDPNKVQSGESKSFETKIEEPNPANTSHDSWLDESDDSILEVEGIQLTKNGVIGFEDKKVTHKESSSSFEVDDLFGNSPENKQEESNTNNFSDNKGNNKSVCDTTSRENRMSLCNPENIVSHKNTNMKKMSDSSNLRNQSGSNNNYFYNPTVINEQRNQAEVHINIPVTVHLSEKNVFRNNSNEEQCTGPKLLRNEYGDPFAPIHQPAQSDRATADRMSKPSFQNIAHLKSQNYVESEYFQPEHSRTHTLFQNLKPSVSGFNESTINQNKTRISVQNKGPSLCNNGNTLTNNSLKTYFPTNKNLQSNTHHSYSEQGSEQSFNHKQESSQKFEVFSNYSTQDIETYRKSMRGNALLTAKGSKVKKTKTEVDMSPRLSNLVRGGQGMEFNMSLSRATAIRPSSQSQHCERQAMELRQNNTLFASSKPYFRMQDQRNRGSFVNSQAEFHKNFLPREQSTCFGISSQSPVFQTVSQSHLPFNPGQGFGFSNFTQAPTHNSQLPQFNPFTASDCRNLYGPNQGMAPVPWNSPTTFRKASEFLQTPQVFNPRPVTFTSLSPPEEEYMMYEEGDSDGPPDEVMNSQFAFSCPDSSPSPPLSGEYFEKALNQKQTSPKLGDDREGMPFEEAFFH